MAEQKDAAKTVTARVPEAMKDKIVKIAKSEKRTVSNLAGILLEEALRARKPSREAV